MCIVIVIITCNIPVVDVFSLRVFILVLECLVTRREAIVHDVAVVASGKTKLPVVSRKSTS